jgi:glycine/D-amino acid oxidase-like deaminating enzyme
MREAGHYVRLLESVEAVALGIDGKLALWRSLSAAAEINAELRGVDYGQLSQRAEEQRERAEKVRLSAAKTALARM